MLATFTLSLVKTGPWGTHKLQLWRLPMGSYAAQLDYWPNAVKLVHRAQRSHAHEMLIL